MTEPIEMPFELCGGSDGPKESCVRWGPDPNWKGQFLGKQAPMVKYRDTLQSPVQKWLNRSSCHLDCDHGMAQWIM